ncbi:putative peptidase [Saonia flava]|uniref:Putative peptidase n=1 Tax=Saonia flava TaxID=523696 RepID=A0A846QZV9_9FLAO|nr:dienelactone hydrolase family protein [Saonia flava]NJB72450.1 putative peptidase [Saonia flava]
MKIKTIISAFSFIICFTGCSDRFLSAQDNPVNTSQISLADTKKAFSELPFKTGINDFKLNAPNNKTWEFRVIVPEIMENEMVPLFVNLHWSASAKDPNIHKLTDCYIEPALENTNAYILSPNSQGLLWYNPANETQVVNLVNFALENLNIEPEKVVILGYSDGGNGSWFFSETHPELFSASIPMASAYSPTYNSNGEIQKIDMPLYVIHGENDELFPLINTKVLVEQSINAGNQIEFVIAPGLSHFVACDYLPYLQDAVEWVKTSVW